MQNVSSGENFHANCLIKMSVYFLGKNNRSISLRCDEQGVEEGWGCYDGHDEEGEGSVTVIGIINTISQ